ncbi:GNAT family N-acetyltransferase [Spiroplasma sp. DGKH1]|uniref:GNAT family N-acetyltransferase n=1 Tax=Spiroplasma sp. DGKH1 TaxID=3050074 RepID=UPI0034C62AEE
MLIIKPVNNIDALYLFQLEKENYPQHYYKYRNLIQMINNPQYYFYKITRGDNIILGYFILLKSGDDLEIIKLTVAKKYHHQGYGSKMLNYIINNFQYHNIFLEVRVDNQNALKLYYQQGFVKIREIPNYYGQIAADVLQYHQ